MCALKARAGPVPLPGSSAKTLNRSSNMPTRIGLKSCSCSQPWIASPTGPSPPGGLSMLAIVRTRSTSSCWSIRARTAAAAFGSIATLSPAEDFEADELVVDVDQRERNRITAGRIVRLVQARERPPGRDAQAGALFLVLGQGGDLHDRVIDGRSTVQGAESEERGGQRLRERVRRQRFPGDDVADGDRHVLGRVVARARDEAIAVGTEMEDLDHSVGRRPLFQRDLGANGIA